MRTKRATSKVDGLRALLGGIVLAATVALVTSTWLGRGFSIDGGSMAPGLLGPHASLECPACGLPFVVGVEEGGTLARPAACPNCGSQVDRPAELIASGDGVLVDRRAFQFRAPRRYEVASLREPNKASQLCVKRVVGLPGERVAVRDGDVFIDGRISRKSLAEQQAVALLVHDNSFRPRDATSPARWQPELDTSRWRAVDGEYNATSNAGADIGTADTKLPPATNDWLSYRHLVRVGDSAEFIESPVLDTQAYNQTRPITDPYAIRDLALAVDVQAQGPGKIFLRANDTIRRGRRPDPLPPGEGEVRATADLYCQLDVSSGHWDLREGEQSLTSGTATPLADGRSHSIYFSTFDQQVLLAIDGQVVFEHPFDELDEKAHEPERGDLTDSTRREPRPPGRGSSRPFAIASDCASLRITALRVERDVYYTPAGPARGDSPDTVETQLAPDEFFVLSDNSRLGLDSRYLDFGPAVPFNLFVGKPLTAYSRSPRAPGWWGGIQVPAVWRIRYIR